MDVCAFSGSRLSGSRLSGSRLSATDFACVLLATKQMGAKAAKAAKGSKADQGGQEAGNGPHGPPNTLGNQQARSPKKHQTKAATAATTKPPSPPPLLIHDALRQACTVIEQPLTKDRVVEIGSQRSSLPPAPRVIWTYWRQADMPPIVNLCVASWRHFYPGFTIHVVTPRSVNDFLPDLDLAKVKWIHSAARESDVVRLHLVAKFGGVWLDASTLLNAPMPFVEGVYAAKGPAFVGFYHNGYVQVPCWPMIEGWAFAARPGSVFMKRWLQAFFTDTPNEPEGMSQALARNRHIHAQNMRAVHYLYIDFATQIVIQGTTDPVALRDLSIRVSGGERGPFLFLDDNKWDSTVAVARMQHEFLRPGSVYTMFKLRNKERRVVTQEIVDALTAKLNSAAKSAKSAESAASTAKASKAATKAVLT